MTKQICIKFPNWPSHSPKTEAVSAALKSQFSQACYSLPDFCLIPLMCHMFLSTGLVFLCSSLQPQTLSSRLSDAIGIVTETEHLK